MVQNIWRIKKTAAILGVLSLVLTSTAEAGDTVISFDIGVNSCSGCSTFTPFHFLETWTLPDYVASAPTLYDFGGGNSMLKATISSGAIVSPSPNSDVLAAAGMSASDVSPNLYVENATYLTNGVGNGSNVGDLQFRNQTTLKPANGDGTYEYLNYYQSMYFGISGANFSNIEAITPTVLATYLTPGLTSGWGESGSWEHLGDCCTNAGRFTRSYLAYSGVATVLDVQFANPVPEPETYAMLLAGLGMLGFVARRRKQNL